jgi:hypothetical protein
MGQELVNVPRYVFKRKNDVKCVAPAHMIHTHTHTHTHTQEFGKVPHYLLKRKEEMLTRQQKVHERLKEHPTDCPEVYIHTYIHT